MGFKYRKYKNYAEYLAHQVRKVKKKGTLPRFKKRFSKRYSIIHARIKKLTEGLEKGIALCLGARLGEEVKSFLDLGFEHSIGVDLHPGPDNPYVVEGDFHHLKFEDKNFSIVYTNSIDHVFNLNQVIEECSRVLEDHGIVIIEMSKSERFTTKWRNKKGYSQIESPRYFESMVWNQLEDLVDSFKSMGFEEIRRVDDKSRLGVIFKKEHKIRR